MSIHFGDNTMKNINKSMGHLSDVYTTPGQAASLLLVNRLTIRRWVKEGKLHGERVGNITLIPKVDVWHIAQQRGINLDGR
jgi:excisionase family DNA binding protein